MMARLQLAKRGMSLLTRHLVIRMRKWCKANDLEKAMMVVSEESVDMSFDAEHAAQCCLLPAHYNIRT